MPVASLGSCLAEGFADMVVGQETGRVLVISTSNYLSQVKLAYLGRP